MKKGYALFITLFLVVILSFLSIQILQNKAFFSELISLKYLELQATIYQKKSIEYFNIHKNFENFSLRDDRFIFLYNLNNETNTTYFYIQAKEKPLRLVYTIQE